MGIENTQIGGTLIALSVPALKTVFGNLFSYLTKHTTSSRNQSRSKSGNRLSQSKHGTSGLSSTVRYSERLAWSKHGNDDYEMMSDNVSRECRGVDGGGGGGGERRREVWAEGTG